MTVLTVNSSPIPAKMEPTPVIDYHAIFEAVPPVGLLSTMGPFLSTDVTNPRELYSILSEAKYGKGTLLTPVTVNPPPTARLPPLSSSEFRPFREQTQYSSYPDLVTAQRQHGSSSQLDTGRRTASLQNISVLSDVDSPLVSKKLTPISRASEVRSVSDKGAVKFRDKKKVHLVKDRPLPPIEGKIGATSTCHGNGSEAESEDAAKEKEGEGTNLALNHSQQLAPYFSRRASECPWEIFPRGQPAEVKKPVTPTYDDYPEAYWELRSPTLQDPRDLKEDMIDRDQYRLQQISALHLRAMNREVIQSRLESSRKGQHEYLPPLGQSSKTHKSRAAISTDQASPRRRGKQQRFSLAVRNHSLAVVPKTATCPSVPALKKQNKSNIMVKNENNDAKENTNNHEQPALALGSEAGKTVSSKVHRQDDVKKIKASVVNLCMSTDRTPRVTMSAINPGRRTQKPGTRPQSNKARSQHHQQGQGDWGQGQNHGPQITALFRGLSASSSTDTASSSLSHYMQGALSLPCHSPPPNSLAVLSHRNAEPAPPDATKKKNAASKLIFKKFNKLQVFSENVVTPRKSHHHKDWGVVQSMRICKKPYMPQNRPPTYRLDMRNYPPNHLDSTQIAVGEEVKINMEGGGCRYSILVSERGGMPIVSSTAADKVDAASLSFRFRDGEVIVSRQGKKPSQM